MTRVKHVLDTLVEIKSAELLKKQETSLSSDLGKIRGAEQLETSQKPLSISFKKSPILLER